MHPKEVRQDAVSFFKQGYKPHQVMWNRTAFKLPITKRYVQVEIDSRLPPTPSVV